MPIYIHVNSRNFQGSLDHLSNPNQANLLQKKFGIQEYWVINHGWIPSKGDSTFITTIIWTKELGFDGIL